jgi:hypothetical protein
MLLLVLFTLAHMQTAARLAKTAGPSMQWPGSWPQSNTEWRLDVSEIACVSCMFGSPDT